MVAIAWAAGFLEGEGSFVASGSVITISAVQVQRDPLERMQALFGGHLKPYTHKNRPGAPYWRWSLNGSHAVGAAFTIFTFMSPRRREQIHRLVAVWKSRPGRNNLLKTHCPRGHEYTPDNIYVYGKAERRTARRHCLACVRHFYPENRRLKMGADSSAPQPLGPGGTPGE